MLISPSSSELSLYLRRSGVRNRNYSQDVNGAQIYPVSMWSYSHSHGMQSSSSTGATTCHRSFEVWQSTRLGSKIAATPTSLTVPIRRAGSSDAATCNIARIWSIINRYWTYWYEYAILGYREPYLHREAGCRTAVSRNEHRCSCA